MAKRSRTTRIKVIKNMNMIGAGSKIPEIRNEKGVRQWTASVEAGKKTIGKPSLPTTVPSLSKVNALKSTTNLTPQGKVGLGTKSSKIEKGAAKLIASQKDVKPAVKSPSPTKKPPTPGR